MKRSVYIATSLDGYIARTDGGLDWLEHDSGGDDYGFAAFMSSVDTIVMGRSTFEQVLTFGQWAYGERRFVVMSRTKKTFDVPEVVTAQIEVSSLTPRDLVHSLESRGASHVYVDGGRIIQAFVADGLIDEIIITRVPVLLGSGIPLFGALEADVPLQHVTTKAFPSGMVQSSYRLD
jgi:dihydrofolate reductase